MIFLDKFLFPPFFREVQRSTALTAGMGGCQ
jgi:hypothetical protein